MKKKNKKQPSAGSLSKLLTGVFFMVVMLICSGVAFSQDKTVRGRITTTTGTPIPGVSIQVSETNLGATTNENGEFSINAVKGNVLVVSSVGYTNRQITVGDDVTINIQLSSAVQDMGEVVVVGYGTQRKRDVTGAVVSVSEKALREVPVANLQQALIGRAAGLEIQAIGNQPGAGGQIRIRGNRSISGSNEPLFVVDGIPYDGSLNDINPDDIASVDILKDASATAIYGSRGANGVILVTTKKGRNGETRLSYNGYYGIGSPLYKYPLFNASEYQSLRNLSTWTAGYMPEELVGITEGRNTNWQDLMYENAQRTDHNLSVSGGRDGNTFMLGGGYYKETTLMPGEDYTRYTLRAAIDTRVGKHIKLGVSTQNTVSIAKGSQFVSGSAMFRTLALSPLMPAYNPDGSIYLLPNGNVDDNNTDGRYNPLLLKDGPQTWVDRVRRLRTFNTVYAEIEFFKGLRYRANVGLNYAQENSGQFRSADRLPANPSFFRPAQGNIARVGNGETWGYTIENLLFYDKTVGDHKFNFTALYSIQEAQSFNSFVQKDSITEDFVQFYNLAQSTPVNSSNTALGGGESKTSLISYMARLNYSFKDRYLLTATFRRDGSSRLAPGNKWFDYPALSAGWVISDESFFSNVKAVNTLKLRVGWGKTSNQAIDPYQSKGLVNNSNGLPAGNTGGNVIRYNYGPTVVTGYNVITLPNPNLSWEFTTTTNIGLDFGLLKNRITGTFEYYNSRTKDILYAVNLPVTSGVAGGFVTNIGEMENKGMEFTVSSVNIESKSGFNWSTDLNLFFNNNKLLKLSNNVSEDIGSQLFVGHSMTAIYDYVNQGVWQLDEAAAAAAVGAMPGQIKLLDFGGANGRPDGMISSTNDRRIIGDMDADLQGGITNRFSYKGFDLSSVITARFGGTLVSQIHQPLSSYITFLDGRRNSVKVDYWTPTNPSNWFPMPQTNVATVTDGSRTLGYYDASYIRIRSINLGYTFNRNFVKRLNAQSLRVYFTVDNVALLYSPYWEKTGIDPQATASGDRGVGGSTSNIRTNERGNGALVVGLGTPPRRTFTFGLNLSL
ncbi:TonB-dependent receptor [Terrimonas sp. NA20]|uniref:TonB-dependent receptor n=1 Tax=Terrimonas ginsenosidimutans TaxID=2908004 RepID=A0ABS9KPQ0_9BACT|nr:TonB-dependent receptor [Terrimonas ginsenosidimutans]MCG2614292.1 TonB-dependent receptor [Terrimonas ginsenosidimutans]